MIKVYQTTFKGKDAPIEEQGNCWQATVASILEIDLADAFDVRQYDQEKPEESKWFDKFNEWLAQYGLGCVFVGVRNKDNLPITSPPGYHMAEVKSTTLTTGETHIVVIKGLEVVHDPNPHAEKVGDLIAIYLFVPLDVARVRR